jgi:RecJ-like exonuclease
MTIYRTIKKEKECTVCGGSGHNPLTMADCSFCEGTGKQEVYSRVSRAAASRAEKAVKELPPRMRAVAKERLQDQESKNKKLPKEAKDGKVGDGFISEE